MYSYTCLLLGRIGWARIQLQDPVTSASSESSFDSGTSSGGGWTQVCRVNHARGEGHRFVGLKIRGGVARGTQV